MARQQQPPQQPPPVQRILLQYGKRARMSFASHRDFARALERGLRRAEIPMAYSSGFNPHPRISYVNPAPTGVESEAEYLVISLKQICDPADVRTRLSAVMPEDFPIIAAKEVDPDQSWEASLWEIHALGVDDETLKEAVSSFISATEIPVSREVKTGLRTFDARGSVESLMVVAPGTLHVVIRHGEPLVRPSEVVGALNLPGVQDPMMKRLNQGTVETLTGN